MQGSKGVAREEVEQQRLVVGQLELAVHHLNAMTAIVGNTAASTSRWREMLNARARHLHGKLTSMPARWAAAQHLNAFIHNSVHRIYRPECGQSGKAVRVTARRPADHGQWQESNGF